MATLPDPALPDLLSYRDHCRTRCSSSRRIALLPQSGVYANVAAAIRDGIVINLFDILSTQPPRLRFYDATDPAGIWPLACAVTEAPGSDRSAAEDAVSQLCAPANCRAGARFEPGRDRTRPTANMYFYSLAPEDGPRPGRRAHRWQQIVIQWSWFRRGLGRTVIATAFEHAGALSGNLAATCRPIRRVPRSRLRTPITWVLHSSIRAPNGIASCRSACWDASWNSSHAGAPTDAVFLAARPVQAQACARNCSSTTQPICRSTPHRMPGWAARCAAGRRRRASAGRHPLDAVR